MQGASRDEYFDVKDGSGPGNDPGNEGYITISKQAFTTSMGIYGVTFEACQDDEWFFMGTSPSGSISIAPSS